MLALSESLAPAQTDAPYAIKGGAAWARVLRVTFRALQELNDHQVLGWRSAGFAAASASSRLAARDASAGSSESLAEMIARAFGISPRELGAEIQRRAAGLK